LKPFDATDGERLWTQDLITPLATQLDADGAHLCNDLTGDGQGNLYAVDSYAPIIWKLSTDGTNLEIFSTNELYDLVGNVPIGLNGLAYHADGFLLVMHYGGSYLMKIPTEGDSVGIPNVVEDVGGTSELLDLPDGIGLANSGRSLLVTAGGDGEYVLGYNTDDNWESMSLFTNYYRGSFGASSIVEAEGIHYAVNCHVNDLFGGYLRTRFEIERVYINDFFDEEVFDGLASGLVFSVPVVLSVLFSLLM